MAQCPHIVGGHCPSLELTMPESSSFFCPSLEFTLEVHIAWMLVLLPFSSMTNANALTLREGRVHLKVHIAWRLVFLPFATMINDPMPSHCRRPVSISGVHIFWRLVFLPFASMINDRCPHSVGGQLVFLLIASTCSIVHYWMSSSCLKWGYFSSHCLRDIYIYIFWHAVNTAWRWLLVLPVWYIPRTVPLHCLRKVCLFPIISASVSRLRRGSYIAWRRLAFHLIAAHCLSDMSVCPHIKLRWLGFNPFVYNNMI